MAKTKRKDRAKAAPVVVETIRIALKDPTIVVPRAGRGKSGEVTYSAEPIKAPESLRRIPEKGTRAWDLWHMAQDMARNSTRKETLQEQKYFANGANSYLGFTDAAAWPGA